MARLSFFAPCPAGVESLLADELRRLRLRGVRPQRSGVLFAGEVADGQRAVYWSRLASRVLLTLAEVDATSADAFYGGVREIAWEEHVRATGTIAVDAGGVNDALRNTQFTAVRAKDAVADRFRERFGRRPSVDVRTPDLRINIAVRAGKATISIDLAGVPLHRRGYRKPGVQVAAPMKETLAAAVLEAAGWREIAAAGGAFADPMCGSGTLAIEAGLAAAEIAPGLLRADHPVRRWLGFDAASWERMVAAAEERRRERLASLPPILARDSDAEAVEIARQCVRRAGLDRAIRVERADLATFTPPSGAERGLIATNPPWGERLSAREGLPTLYATLVERVRGHDEWLLAVVSPDPALARGLGMHPRSSRTLGTGKAAATLTIFEPGAPAPSANRRASAPGSTSAQSQPRSDAHLGAAKVTVAADEFANRLGKMARHYGKWARRSGVGCYRVYDADLPDFAFAVDIYEGAGPDAGKRWAHVSEYAAPRYIDADLAAARLAAAVAVIPEVLGVSESDVFVKRRERQRGTAQYEKRSRNGVTGTVAENGLLFSVNFTDYLDTGLFLDHRDTRDWIRGTAEGKEFLNLFAYTGSVSVYAAAGGALSTTSVDLSATYLAWARRNLALNGLDTESNTQIQADVTVWVREAKAEDAGRYGLIFCDPPTFSNSKRTEGTWDVQRDHVQLLADLRHLLADDGLLVFSCNRRGFKLDEAAVAEVGLVAKDITARTLPRDFERTPHIHHCWEMRRA